MSRMEQQYNATDRFSIQHIFHGLLFHQGKLSSVFEFTPSHLCLSLAKGRFPQLDETNFREFVRRNLIGNNQASKYGNGIGNMGCDLGGNEADIVIQFTQSHINPLFSFSASSFCTSSEMPTKQRKYILGSMGPLQVGRKSRIALQYGA